MTCSLRNIRLARLMINGSPEANCAIECECERSKVNHTLYKLQREREREKKYKYLDCYATVPQGYFYVVLMVPFSASDLHI